MFLGKPLLLFLKSFAASTLAIFLASQTLAQVRTSNEFIGIKAPAIDLPLPGNWQARPDWVESRDSPPLFPFYENEQGTVLYIRGGDWPWKAEELGKIVEQLKQIEAEPTAHPGFAHFLAKSWFSFPLGYLKQAPLAKEPVRDGWISPYGSINPNNTRIWDDKHVQGDAEWFYVSQLTPGHIHTRHDGKSFISTEYAPTKLTLAERRQVGIGELLLFELETVYPSAERAIDRFQMPQSLKGQRVRYGWVAYGREGLNVGKPVLNFVFATSAKSGLDCSVLSGYLPQAKLP
ncbi:MAG TPA: hypothetical protein VJN92_22825 [Candidatus Acidoferrum sp.]|nr:hypothetical protein [Candidatus Acidoferrum sp.]